MKIDLKTTFPELQKKINQIGSQATSVLREALNRTAEWSETDVRREMRERGGKP